MSLEAYAIANLLNTGVPALGCSSGHWVDPPQDLGAGDFVLSTTPEHGFETDQSVVLATPRGILAGSDLSTIAYTPTTAIAKHFTTLREGAGGAISALTDFSFDLLVARIGAWSSARVLGLGRILGGVNPAWQWAVGGIDVTAGIVRNGVGDYEFAMVADRGWDLNEGVILAQSADNKNVGLQSVAVNHISNTVKQLTLVEENLIPMNPSALTDFDVNVAILLLGARPGQSCGKFHSACSVVGGAVPTYLWASGAIDQALGLQRTAAGVYTVTHLPEQGTDLAMSCDFALPRGVQAASGMRAISLGRPTDIDVAILLNEEQAAGAPSIHADFDFDLLSFRAG